MKIHLDVETFSLSPLVKVGAYQYHRHPTTGCFLFCYRINSEPIETVQLWRPPIHGAWQPAPTPASIHRLLDLIRSGAAVVAHNAGFELDAWNLLIVPELAKRSIQAPLLTIEQMDCTMARCNALALPGALEDAANVLRLKQRKDMTGKALMTSMMTANPGNAQLCTQENLDRLGIYCCQDVETECALDGKIPALIPHQRRVWILDQKINARGIPFDIERIRRCQALADRSREKANALFAALTLGECTSVSQNTKFLSWLRNRQAVADALPGLDTVGDFQLSELQPLIAASDPQAHEAIEVRRYAAKSSLAKLDAILLACGVKEDDMLRDRAARGLKNYKGEHGQVHALPRGSRAYGQYYFMGAGTGRFTGKAVQPQNIVRFDDSDGSDDRHAAQALGEALDNIVGMGGAASYDAAIDYVERETRQPFLKVASKCLRTFIKAGD